MNMKKMGLMGSCGLLVALITCAMTLDTQANMLIYPASGGIRQRRQNQQANEANQQTASQYQANLDNYNKAKSLCLEGRGYKVK